MPLHAWSSSRYAIPLPAGHRFPIEKYELLRAQLASENLVIPGDLHEPRRVPIEHLLRVHTREYVQRLTDGTLAPEAMRKIGFPWSGHLVERSYRAVGGTLEAAEYAMQHGIAINLAGGTHHAFPDRGEGFCVFNDVAVAVRALQATLGVKRVAIIDLDVHQGNGTNAIFTGDHDVFTFSMHGGRNYPFNKVPGSLDIELDDRCNDHTYLSLLTEALPRAIAIAAPDVVFYLAGADPHEGDRLGRLQLTFDGLARRDMIVLETCRAIGIPVVITIAGGYGRQIEDTVRVHMQTVRTALNFV